MHPISKDIVRQSNIDQTRISHIMSKLWMEDLLVKATVESANTACGRDFRGLIEQGSNVAFSMRGFSKAVQENNGVIDVLGPLKIICYDWIF